MLTWLFNVFYFPTLNQKVDGLDRRSEGAWLFNVIVITVVGLIIDKIASRVMSFGGWLIRLGVGPSERTCAVSMIESEDSRFKLERERKRKRESKYFAKENNSSICIFNEWISLIAAKGYLICCRVFPPPLVLVLGGENFIWKGCELA